MNEASANPEAWKAYRAVIKSGGYNLGEEESRDAWLWFLSGWLASKIHILHILEQKS